MAKNKKQKAKNALKKFGGRVVKSGTFTEGASSFVGGFVPAFATKALPTNIPKNVAFVGAVLAFWGLGKLKVLKPYSSPAIHGALGALGANVQTNGFMGRSGALNSAQLERLRRGMQHRPAGFADRPAGFTDRPAGFADMSAPNTPTTSWGRTRAW